MGIKEKKNHKNQKLRQEKQDEEFRDEMEIENFMKLKQPSLTPLNQLIKKKKKGKSGAGGIGAEMNAGNGIGAESAGDVLEKDGSEHETNDQELEDELEMNAYLSLATEKQSRENGNQENGVEDEDHITAVYYENKTVALLDRLESLKNTMEFDSTLNGASTTAATATGKKSSDGDFKNIMIVDDELLSKIPQKIFEFMNNEQVSQSTLLKKKFGVQELLPTDQIDANDDLNREKAFMNQALKAAVAGRYLLVKQAVPFTRPNDYFAEMVKSDTHMEKVRTALLNQETDIKAQEDARKKRHLKKFGKQVQIEKVKERHAEKKKVLDKVASLRKKSKENGGAADVDFDVETLDQPTSSFSKKNNTTNRTRVKKNQKFGFGGAKRHAKSNTKDSTNDISSFSYSKMKNKNQKGKVSKKQRR